MNDIGEKEGAVDGDRQMKLEHDQVGIDVSKVVSLVPRTPLMPADNGMPSVVAGSGYSAVRAMRDISSQDEEESGEEKCEGTTA